MIAILSYSYLFVLTSLTIYMQLSHSTVVSSDLYSRVRSIFAPVCGSKCSIHYVHPLMLLHYAADLNPPHLSVMIHL